MEGLRNYPAEVRGIADELISFLKDDGIRQAAFGVLRERGDRLFSQMTEDERDRAIKFFSATPSQRDRSVAKLDFRGAAILVLQARYVGLASAQALHFADRFQFVPGKAYRKAGEFSANEVLNARFFPYLEEIMPGWSPVADRDRYDRPAKRTRWKLLDD